MLDLGTRPIPTIPMTAPCIPYPWRGIVEQELTAAQVSVRDMLTGKRWRYMVKLRRRIWSRLIDEAGANPNQISIVFGFHHTTVLNTLGRLGRCR